MFADHEPDTALLPIIAECGFVGAMLDTARGLVATVQDSDFSGSELRPSASALLAPLGGEVMVVDDPTAAELVKCTQNAWNATKISFWNEAWLLACALEVDAGFVSAAVARAAEGSYNPEYGIRGGHAFAGACLEKDTQGLATFAASVEVPTPSGPINVKIPAGAQSGQQLRIKGKGVAAHGQTPAGDLYLRLMVRVPKEEVAQEVIDKIDQAYGENVRQNIRL